MQRTAIIKWVPARNAMKARVELYENGKIVMVSRLSLAATAEKIAADWER